jgi:hypothetical protein
VARFALIGSILVRVDTPGAVIVARLIGWLQVGGVLVMGFAAWLLDSSFGDFGVKIGFVVFLIAFLIACYFGIPLLFLQRGQPGGRIAVMIVEGFAVLVQLIGFAARSDVALLPYLFACALVVGLLALPSAGRWSNPPRPILVPSPFQYQMPAGPWATGRETAATPFAFQRPMPPAYPALPPPGAYVGEPVMPPPPPPPTGPVPGAPPPPPVVPPGYRWQPPDYRNPRNR